MNGRLCGVALVVAMLPLTACGVATTPLSPASAAAATTPAAPKAHAAAKTTARAVTAAKVAKIKVPNGVGLDYQSAQDRWRAAGLHVLPAVDATGAHRLPLIDANWIVLSQDPKAGKKVARGSFITATVKKFSD